MSHDIFFKCVIVEMMLRYMILKSAYPWAYTHSIYFPCITHWIVRHKLSCSATVGIDCGNVGWFTTSSELLNWVFVTPFAQGNEPTFLNLSYCLCFRCQRFYHCSTSTMQLYCRCVIMIPWHEKAFCIICPLGRIIYIFIYIYIWEVHWIQ